MFHTKKISISNSDHFEFRLRLRLRLQPLRNSDSDSRLQPLSNSDSDSRLKPQRNSTPTPDFNPWDITTPTPTPTPTPAKKPSTPDSRTPTPQPWFKNNKIYKNTHPILGFPTWYKIIGIATTLGAFPIPQNITLASLKNSVGKILRKWPKMTIFPC